MQECGKILGENVSGAKGERRRRKSEFVTVVQRKNAEGKRKTLLRDFGMSHLVYLLWVGFPSSCRKSEFVTVDLIYGK